LNIGIPISDESSDGLTALLSTVEKPPRNVVLAVGINNTYSALNIARKFLGGLNDVVIGDSISAWRGGYVIQDSDKARTSENTAKLKQEFAKYGLSPEVVEFDKLSPDSVVISQFSLDEPRDHMYNIDKLLTKGKGVQVAVPSGKIFRSAAGQIGEYFGTMIYPFENTAFVSSYAAANSYTNVVMAAAQLTRNDDILAKISKEKLEKAAKLNAHKGLLIVNGEVTKL